MVTYCYTNRTTGKTIERKFPMGSAVVRVLVRGKPYYRDTVAEHRGTPGNPGNWPYVDSFGLAVPEFQAKEACKALFDAGVPTEFTKQGGCILRDNQHRNQVLAALGMHDKDAGYGQRARP